MAPVADLCGGAVGADPPAGRDKGDVIIRARRGGRRYCSRPTLRWEPWEGARPRRREADVRIDHDVDTAVPMLMRMFEARVRGYFATG
jgi:hypothetical protein